VINRCVTIGANNLTGHWRKKDRVFLFFVFLQSSCVIQNSDKLQSMSLITLHFSWPGRVDLVHNGLDDYSINTLVKCGRDTVGERGLNQAGLYLHDKKIQWVCSCK